MTVLDSGSTCCMSPHLDDFKTSTYKVKEGNIGGIASGLQAKGIGEVSWTLTNTKGEPIAIEMECLYVPGLPCRLMCPQQLGNSTPTN